MKLKLLTAIFFVALLSTLTTIAQTTSIPTNYVEVRASAERSVTPNKIEVAINLNEEESKGKITLKTQQNNLASALKNIEVDASSALVIVSQSSQAAKRNNTYQYINYLLTLDNAEQLESLFEELNTLQITNARVQRVVNDDIADIAAELRTEAMLKAQKIAEGLAAAVDQTIGKALVIECYSTSEEASNYTSNITMMRSSSMDQDQIVQLPSNLDIRPITVRENVTVKFALQ